MWRVSILFAALLLGCTSGGGKGEVKCIDKLCDQGSVKCFGNYQAACSDDGRKWILTPCGQSNYCSAGICLPRACALPGKKKCLSKEEVSVCSEDGATMSSFICLPGEVCVAGECRSDKCDEGDGFCNFDVSVKCEAGHWVEVPCPEGNACQKDGSDCAKKVCAPEEAKCEANFSKVCSANGAFYSTTECKNDEHCLDGFCQKIVCPLPQDDLFEAGEVVEEIPEVEEVEDILDIEIPELEPVTIAKATINGEEIVFNTYKDAIYKVEDARLQITLVKGTKTIELYVIGIEENQLGQFKCEESTPETRIWYRFGKYPQGSPCKDFDYAATECLLVIDEFGPVGGYVKGSFSGSLADCIDPNDKMDLTDGLFTVKRTQ